VFRRSSGSPILGVDISTSSVKVVEVVRDGRGYRLEHYAAEPMPPQLVSDKVIEDAEQVGEIVRRAVRRSGSRLRKGATAISGAHAIVRTIVLPSDLTEDQRHDQIELQVGDFVSTPLNETSFDYEVLGPRPGDPAHQEVLVVATRRVYVEKREAVFEVAGLEPVAVEIEPYALDRASVLVRDQMRDGGRGRTIAVVDVGATSTTFNLLRDGRIAYTRDQNFGGKHLTDEIMRRYNLSYEEAGRLKRQGGADAHYLKDLVLPFADELAHQIQQAYQFARAAVSELPPLDQLLLCGGSAQIEGIGKLLESRLEIPVKIINLLEGMSVSNQARANLVERDASTLVVACGLSLRAFE
jgi:type IV pilus assembly protein PilM